MEDLKKFNEIFEAIDNKQDASEIMEILSKINYFIDKEQENFIELCFYFNNLKCYFYNYDNFSKMYYGSFENNNGRWFYADIISNFGITLKTVNKMIQVYKRFCFCGLDVAPKIRPAFLGYNKSKLFELLSLSDSQIEIAFDKQLITVNSTVRQIREYIKSFKNGFNVSEEDSSFDYNEEDIPNAFDPNIEYDFSYFDSKSKNQLVTICVAFQKAFQELKNKKKK